MLRFSLFGIPVVIHWMFWIVAALLGHALSARTPLDFQRVLVWVGVVFVSILVHELGHAFAFRKFGGRPSIFLHTLGGLASARGAYTRTQHVIISAAGPAAGFLLGGIFWTLQPDPLTAETWSNGAYLTRVFFGSMFFVNIVWSIVNLLPIPPLDGGQIFAAVYRGRDPRRVIGMVGGVTAVAAAIFLFVHYRSTFAAIMFGFLAYSNFMSAQGRPAPRLF